MNKEQWKNVEEFMTVFSAITGVLGGIGFLFIGLIRLNVMLSFFAIILFLTGMIVIPTMIKEKDEYETKTENTIVS